ncbi:unnamed protein product [Amoebophrya sp. A120]|nr:unnamed protein product [Amoebophrya sp. A120]|eukprot:GSA120T00002710001.1
MASSGVPPAVGGGVGNGLAPPAGNGQAPRAGAAPLPQLPPRPPVAPAPAAAALPAAAPAPPPRPVAAAPAAGSAAPRALKPGQGTMPTEAQVREAVGKCNPATKAKNEAASILTLEMIILEFAAHLQPVPKNEADCKQFSDKLRTLCRDDEAAGVIPSRADGKQGGKKWQWKRGTDVNNVRQLIYQKFISKRPRGKIPKDLKHVRYGEPRATKRTNPDGSAREPAAKKPKREGAKSKKPMKKKPARRAGSSSSSGSSSSDVSLSSSESKGKKEKKKLEHERKVAAQAREKEERRRKVEAENHARRMRENRKRLIDQANDKLTRDKQNAHVMHTTKENKEAPFYHAKEEFFWRQNVEYKYKEWILPGRGNNRASNVASVTPGAETSHATPGQAATTANLLSGSAASAENNTSRAVNADLSATPANDLQEQKRGPGDEEEQYRVIPPTEEITKKAKIAYKFISDPFTCKEGSSIYRVPILGKGQFGTVYKAWRCEYNDQEELLTEKERWSQVALKVSRKMWDKGTWKLSQKIKKEKHYLETLDAEKREHMVRFVMWMRRALDRLQKKLKGELDGQRYHDMQQKILSMRSMAPDTTCLLLMYGGLESFTFDEHYFQVFELAQGNLLALQTKYSQLIAEDALKVFNKNPTQTEFAVDIGSGVTEWYQQSLNTVKHSGHHSQYKKLGLPVHLAGRLAFHVLQAMRFLKHIGYIHTDLKPENICLHLDTNGFKRRNPDNLHLFPPTWHDDAVHGNLTPEKKAALQKLPPGVLNTLKARETDIRNNTHFTASHGLKLGDLESYFANCTAKLADLGEIQKAPINVPSQKDSIQPPWYRAPEVYFGDWPLTPAMDMWSMAVTMHSLCTGGDMLFPSHTKDHGQPPHGCCTKRWHMQRIFEITGPCPRYLVDRAVEAHHKAYFQHDEHGQRIFGENDMPVPKEGAADNPMRPKALKANEGPLIQDFFSMTTDFTKNELHLAKCYDYLKNPRDAGPAIWDQKKVFKRQHNLMSMFQLTRMQYRQLAVPLSLAKIMFVEPVRGKTEVDVRKSDEMRHFIFSQGAVTTKLEHAGLRQSFNFDPATLMGVSEFTTNVEQDFEAEMDENKFYESETIRKTEEDIKKASPSPDDDEDEGPAFEPMQDDGAAQPEEQANKEPNSPEEARSGKEDDDNDDSSDSDSGSSGSSSGEDEDSDKDEAAASPAEGDSNVDAAADKVAAGPDGVPDPEQAEKEAADAEMPDANGGVDAANVAVPAKAAASSSSASANSGDGNAAKGSAAQPDESDRTPAGADVTPGGVAAPKRRQPPALPPQPAARRPTGMDLKSVQDQLRAKLEIEYCDLIWQMITLDKELRITPEKAIKHEFFRTLQRLKPEAFKTVHDA